MPVAGLAVSALLAQAALWTPFSPGIEQRTLPAATAELLALRMDPEHIELRVVLAADLGKAGATAREFVEHSAAVAGVNGGFFDPAMQPIGLRVRDGRPSGRTRAGLGTLVVPVSGPPRIVMGSEIGDLDLIRSAVQCSPRLLLAGQPNRLKPQVSRRTAVAIDEHRRLIFLVTSSGVLEAGEFARLLALPEAAGGFGLRDALNLDGGGSTQLYARAGALELDVQGITPVADALVLVRKPRRGSVAP